MKKSHSENKKQQVEIQEPEVLIIPTMLKTTLVIAGVFIIAFAVSCVTTLLIVHKKITIPSVSRVTFPKIQLPFAKATYDYYQSIRLYVDPVILKDLIDKNDTNVAIVDIRSEQEYKRTHIKNAISMPMYTDFIHVYSSLTDKNKAIANISKQLVGKKLIILYGYRPEADITLDTTEFLIKKKMPVRILSISWNEFKNNFYNWLPGADLKGFSINPYIQEQSAQIPKNE